MPALQKVCCACNADVTNQKRVKDSQGNYYCQACYEAKLAERKAVAAGTVAGMAPPPSARKKNPYDLDEEDGGEIGLAEEINKPEPSAEEMFGCADCKKLLPSSQIRNENGDFICQPCLIKRRQSKIKGGTAMPGTTASSQKPKNIWIQLAIWAGGAVAVVILMAAISFFLPDMSRKVFAVLAIIGIIIHFLGLRWATYTAAADNLGLRLICRFVPFVGIVVVVRRSIIDWGEMQAPVFTALSGLALAIIAGIFWFTIAVSQEAAKIAAIRAQRIHHVQPNPDGENAAAGENAQPGADNGQPAAADNAQPADANATPAADANAPAAENAPAAPAAPAGQ